MQLKGVRWWVIALIALATIINYIDRQALSVLWPSIAEDLFPDESAFERNQIYATISVVFVFSYAFGQAIFGKIFDWIGTRLGFVLAIGVWSIATILHAFAQGVLSFSIFRAILGVAEAGNWPGATKSNADWFPAKERALAQGIFNSGAAIGGIISIPLIAWMALHNSWQTVFIVIGVLGLLWLIPWVILVKAPPKTHPWITPAEREYILTGQKSVETADSANENDEYKPSTVELLKHKQSWGVIIASAAIDPIWWLFVVWTPIFLSDVYGMNLADIAQYGWVPYVGAMFGAWFGGLLAQNRFNAGWTTDKTRKLVITLGCLIMLPALILMVQPLFLDTDYKYISVVVTMAIILFGFQTAIGNVQTLPSDLYSKDTVGTLAGFAGMAAKLAVAGLIWLVPILTRPDVNGDTSYTLVFIIGASLAIIALLAVWLLIPKVEQLKAK